MLRRSSNESVVDCETGRLGTRASVDLGVDRTEMPLDGARAEEEPPADVGAGQTLGDQAQHVDLPVSEPRRVAVHWRDLRGRFVQRVRDRLVSRHPPALGPSYAPAAVVQALTCGGDP